MPVRSDVRLECRIVTRHTSSALDLCRVVDIVADQCCMLEDTSDQYSS